MLKLAMIETKESLEKLDEIMSTTGLDGIYIGPADLSLAIGEEPGFDRAENTGFRYYAGRSDSDSGC